jgi:hypothetical protein
MGQRDELYQSYLLRVWRKRQAGVLHVRLVLVSTSTGTEWHFENLESLIGFLDDTAPRPPGAPPSSAP